MGGELSLKSQPGKGSTFTIKLSDVAIASLTSETEQKQAENETQIQFHPGKILIVDDVEDNRALLMALFADTELQAVEAKNGLEAVNLVNQHQFNLILMDIRMPVMDGYQAAQEIKAFSSIPIVALTASVMTDDFERLKSENFDGCLRKPVLKVDLFSELSKFLPFEQMTIRESAELVKPLTDSERKSLPFALKALGKLIEQSHVTSKSNNISKFIAFSDSLTEITKQHPISIITEYAEHLNNDIESFEISAIKRSLNDYPQLIRQLEQLNNID
jgi:two-component system sensor histidine kinase EvgS